MFAVLDNRGISLMELIIAVTIIGVIASTSAPLLINLLSSVWYAHNHSAVDQVARDLIGLIGKDVREAVEYPDSLRPVVYGEGAVLRLYRSIDPADSIRYYFSSSNGNSFLFRSIGTSSGTPVPDYANGEVDYVTGSFSVDNGTYGVASTGKINAVFSIGRTFDFQPDTIGINLVVYCRNFRSH